MPVNANAEAIVDTVESLAEDIARISPECAAKAMQICSIVQEMRHVPDRGVVQDALDAAMLDSDVSDHKLQVATSQVVSAVRRSPA